MEDLSKYTNLQRRNGRYYFRVRVPLDLIEALGKREIKKSLNTSELSVARSRLPIEQMRADELFHATRKKIAAIAPTTPSHDNLSKDEIERRVILWFYDEAKRQAMQDDADRIGIDEFEREQILENLHSEQAALDSATESTYQHSVTPVLKRLFGPYAAQAATRVAAPLIHQGQIELLYRRLARFGERHDGHTPYLLFNHPTTDTQKVAENNSVSWRELIDRFRQAKIKDGATQKTINGYKLTFDFSMEFFTPSKLIESIKPDDCRDFKIALSGLPSNAKKRHPSLTLLEATKAASGSPESHLSITSVNGHLSKLSTIFEFAVSEGLIEKNPAKSVKAVPQKRRKKDKRQPFDDFALNLIFNAPLYTGCEDDEYGYNKQGPNKPRRHRFWIPLIALFTGMRLNEICQLFTDDVDELDGIPVIHIRIDEEEQKSLKNTTSERIMPIHHQLIELGFLEYVTSIRQQGYKLLFPHLTKGASGSLSDAFSKWFNRFLHSAGVKAHNDKMVFHSFRHSFRDAARDARIPVGIVSALGGWKESDSVRDEYGSGYKIKALNEELQKIQYLLKPLHLKP